ncbi:MAG: Do family serine endopeptidase [Verrucomicrobia bacterium]|nr:Do family serine endopeptidase [Verrucomicrobiota bacterium]
MKNLLKFLVFVVLVSLGISLLYDYRMKHGGLAEPERAPEKYSLATAPPVDAKQIGTLEEFNRERRNLVAHVVPSVVSVKTSKKIAVRRQYALDPFEYFFGRPRQFRNPNDEATVQNSLGTGVIVTNEGHIITNNHVVDQVDDIEVQLADGRTRKARLVGSDAQVDLAVLKIDDPTVKPLKLGDSDAVQPGDMVLAVGNPFGFEETVTQGIISSKGRPNRVDGFGDFLQTDAAINPGNSGGPLINLQGEVIGINTAIISGSGGSQGIGFAIPSNTVKVAMESLLKRGRIIRGYLGIQAQIDGNGLPAVNADGVVVGDVVPGSPAADAQLQRGDVIRKFNGHDVKSFPELRSLVAQTELNKKIDLEIERNGKPVRVSTELREQPADFQTARAIPRPGQPNPRNPFQPQPSPPANQPEQDEASALGTIRVDELTPQLARQLDLPNAISGVVVTAADSPQLQKGDVIEEVDQQPVRSVAEFNKIVSGLDGDSAHVLSVCRHRVRSFVVLRPR